jgi:hypothetical protein
MSARLKVKPGSSAHPKTSGVPGKPALGSPRCKTGQRRKVARALGIDSLPPALRDRLRAACPRRGGRRRLGADFSLT